MKKNINTIIILFNILLFFYACSKEKNVKSGIPDLTWKHISMTGALALNEAVTFNIVDTAYMVLGITGFGDNKYLYRYDLESEMWNGGEAGFPGEHRREVVAFVIGEKVYVGLGYYSRKTEDEFILQYYKDFYVYDNVKKEWEPLAFEFPGEARRGAVAFSLGGKGYVGTGLTEDKKCLSDFYEFDPKIGWTKIADITSARWGANAFVADGCAYVCFGSLNNGQTRGNWDIQKFDPVSKTWIGLQVYFEDEAVQLIEKTSDVLSFVLNKDGEDFVYFFGGDFTKENSEESFWWGFNPRTNTWRKMGYIQGREYAFSMKNKGYILKVDTDGTTFSGNLFDFAE